MRFEKVSYKQYAKDVGGDVDLTKEYEDIKLPKSATIKSSGRDFYSPFSFTLKAGEEIKIPTGIRVILDDDKLLALFPRSSLGFKYRVQLNNTIGVVDADYSDAENEGHIFAKIINDSREGKSVTINKGDAFMQGIILQYFKTDDDETTEIRIGGIGSTNKKEEV